VEPFKILINGVRTQLGSNLPATVHAFDVSLTFPTQIPLNQVPQVKAWLNSIIDRLDSEYCTYNGILIPSSELKKF